MTSDIGVVHCGSSKTKDCLETVALPLYLDNTANEFSPCECYQDLYKMMALYSNEIQIYIHDDVTLIDSQWRWRIEGLFKSRPECVVAGLGGAVALGHPDLYKKPYSIDRMARRGYVSNQTGWEVHGGCETGAKRVAVVDAFFMAVRTDFLRAAGGWPAGRLTHHCLDLWICCEAARRGKEVWMVGAEATHHGGGTSIGEKYLKAKWLQGGSVDEDHARPHRWLFDEYRDVLPIEVE
jgi:hypothetical protein